jgi:hypothetical protein
MAQANDSDSTKAAFDRNWVSATKAGEYLTEINNGAWILALFDIRDALLGGCPAVLELNQGGQKSYVSPAKPKEFWAPPNRPRLCWVNALDSSMRREDYPGRAWPWELRAYLSPSERGEVHDVEGHPLAREQVSSTPRVFLRRADAVQWGLLPALESPQAAAREVPPSPDKQPDPTVGSQIPAHAQSAPEQPETPPSTPDATSASDAKAAAEESMSEPTSAVEPEPVPLSPQIDLEPPPPSPQVELEPPPPARRGGRPGRPEQYDWDEGFQFMRRELDKRGDPLDPTNAVEKWRTDFDVAKLVAAHIAIGDRKSEPKEPDLKHTARRIRPELEKWRAEQAERNQQAERN